MENAMHFVASCRLVAATVVVAGAMVGSASAADRPKTVKVPCRDMGDGRVLIDSQYLPEGYDLNRSTYDIIKVRVAENGEEWANRVCTIRIHY
jgi:hypothetical protein